MAENLSDAKPSKKRKRDDPNDNSAYKAQVANLADQVRETPENYNAIKTLLRFARKEGTLEFKGRTDATLALCVIFGRLKADGKLLGAKPALETDPNENVVSRWLTERFDSYQNVLLGRLDDETLAAGSFDILLFFINEEPIGKIGGSESKDKLFSRLLEHLLAIKEPLANTLCPKLASHISNRSDQARSQTFAYVAECVRKNKDNQQMIGNAITLLSSPRLNEASHLSDDIAGSGISHKRSGERKNAQQAWLAILGQELTKDQRKKILAIMTNKILPWFRHVEVLMDFLTDSFDQGGATSLLALESLFFLMQEKNLDYPDFYVKLYSLLDDNILHSKHRSRFFRLLKTFMSSTHLPAALVASFIKRLSRLSLHGPPAGIVAVVPWIYNMLKTHPTCTFMIHREPRTADQRNDIEEHGVEDPFDMTETDPMQTDALESSLWEIETVQSHYHPNVASIAKLISEQFTKQSYDLEDFLDHSYNSLLDSELRKPLKKTPVVEFQIPKTIFRDDVGQNHLEMLLKEVMATS